jgi:AraC-like DNA-binding protein
MTIGRFHQVWYKFNTMPDNQTFAWPMAKLPHVSVVGRFALGDRDYNVRYFSRTHALHIHDYAARMRLGGREIELQPGDVTLSSAKVQSRYDLPTPGHHWCVHFWPAKGRGDVAKLPVHFSLGGLKEFAARRIMEIARLQAQRDQSPIAESAASAALLELLLWLAMRAGEKQGGDRAGRTDSCVERAAAILQSRLIDPPTIPELSEQVGLTQNYLARQFRARYGMTLPHYLLTRRIEYASYLLENTDLAVGEIARRCGMEDAQYFNKQFRSLNGMSPSGFRANS